MCALCASAEETTSLPCLSENMQTGTLMISGRQNLTWVSMLISAFRQLHLMSYLIFTTSQARYKFTSPRICEMIIFFITIRSPTPNPPILPYTFLHSSYQVVELSLRSINSLIKTQRTKKGFANKAVLPMEAIHSARIIYSFQHCERLEEINNICKHPNQTPITKRSP